MPDQDAQAEKMSDDSKLPQPVPPAKAPPAVPPKVQSSGASSSRSPPPSYFSGSQHEASVPSRSQLIAVLNTLQGPLDPAVIATVQKEPFDKLHDFRKRELKKDGRIKKQGARLRFRDQLCLTTIALAMVAVFGVYPVLRYYLQLWHDIQASAHGIGPGGFKKMADFALDRLALIDQDTPATAMSRRGFDGHDYELVFSDEFNHDGRTFWPGDDPWWEAWDGWNAGTEDLQWYDRRQVETKDGALVITIDKAPKGYEHNLSYISGQLTGWNKMCFTGGYVEVSVSMPGDNKGQGFWPAVWLLGNLGRAGHGGTLEGSWPYSYAACDVGTLKGQTPEGHEQSVANALPGQRLSACTCPNSDHPGPKQADGTYVGRGAPEIDVVEGYVDDDGGAFSNALPMAPFDNKESWDQGNDTHAYYRNDFDTTFNGVGGTLQAEYAVTRSKMDQRIWGSTFGTFGVEWAPSFFTADGGQITWSHENQALWMINDKAFPKDEKTSISQREISKEPSYLVLNIALSETWHKVDLDSLTFPAQLRIDYVRVYQRTGAMDVTCDPPRAPTADYIQRHVDAYTDPQILTWTQSSKQKGAAPRSWPKNSLADGGC